MCEWNRNVIIQDLVLAIVINTSATIIDGAPFDHTWYTFTCVALATNVIGQLILPTGAVARALTGWAGDAYMQAVYDCWQALPVIHTSGLCLTDDGALTSALSQEDQALYRRFAYLSYYRSTHFDD